ncbi:MAG: Asp-tRNA(Asn)/Glu-tRNA(Gln) amidotransferase subunit GatB [Candidatus Micrarchaeota archaeon]
MKTIIGLEIHVQLNTNAKIFCACPANYGHTEPNTNICPICTGQPGSKPMSVNMEVISHCLKIAKMLDANPVLGKDIYIQRKHYFYPDLPSGYQRTSRPIAKNGELNGIGIWEIHFEEDPGRYELKKGFVDYNRSGVPLVEIVTAPDIKNPEHAREFLSKLEHYLRYFDVIKDEVGTMRIDANISIEGSARIEIKNINSFSNVYHALLFEIKRQKTQIEQGIRIVQETRHFDENSGITIRLRKKETADDYRYVPDPDIAPLVISTTDWKTAEAGIKELPDVRAEKIAKEYNIEIDDAKVLTIEKEFADAYEQLARNFHPQKLANWMRGPLRKQLNYRNLLFRTSGLSERHVFELYKMFCEGKITDKVVEQILIKMLDSDAQEKDEDKELKSGLKLGSKSESEPKLKPMPSELVKKLELLKTDDNVTIREICNNIVKENPKAVEDYKTGNTKSIFFLVGKVMQKTKGTADAKEIEGIIKNLILINKTD